MDRDDINQIAEAVKTIGDLVLDSGLTPKEILVSAHGYSHLRFHKVSAILTDDSTFHYAAFVDNTGHIVVDGYDS